MGSKINKQHRKLKYSDAESGWLLWVEAIEACLRR